MRITNAERKRLQFAQEELSDLAHLVERIFDQNAEDSSNEDLNAIGHLSELILETSKHLKALRKRKDVTQ
jgi:hypothetical protein